MKIEDGLEALQKSELIPDDIYDAKIIGVKDVIMRKLGGKVGCVATFELESAQEAANNVPEVIGRTVDYWLVGKSRYGLRRLLEHMKQNIDGFDGNVPGGDTANLAGYKIKIRISSSQNPNTEEWENRATPL